MRLGTSTGEEGGGNIIWMLKCDRDLLLNNEYYVILYLLKITSKHMYIQMYIV